MNKRLLGKFGSISLIEQDFGGEVAFVSFNEFGLVSSGTKFWGDVFFEKCNVSSYGVVTDTPNWYPREDMVGVIDAIRMAAQGRRLVTYGFSQGGYGALKFSKALGAHASISFSPQYSINPNDLCGKDNRFARYFTPVSGGNRILSDELCQKNYIIYDKANINDAFNVSRLQLYGNVELVLSPFMGHGTVRLLTESGASYALIEKFTHVGLPDSSEIRKIIRSARNRSSDYALGKAAYLIDRLPQWEVKLFRLIPKLAKIYRTPFLAILLYSMGLSEEALDMLKKSDEEALKRIGVFKLWKLFRRMNQKDGELIVARLMTVVCENDAFMRLYIVNTYIHLGMRDEAARELNQITSRFGVEKHQVHIKRFSESLGLNNILARLESYRIAS